jgi:hypothetical protein
MEQTHQLTQHECRECKDVITNPMCPGCVAKGVEQWALIWMPELIPHLKIDDSLNGTGTHCILCNRNMSQCAHCYSKEIYDLVVEAMPELQEEYLQHFNFELRENLN